LRVNYEKFDEQQGESRMKLDAKDFKRLQWAIAFLVIMAPIGGGSLWTTHQLKKNSEKTFKEVTAARRDMQAKLARASEEQQELRDKIARFQELKAKGYIGAEHRLDWIEAIARIKVRAASSSWNMNYRRSGRSIPPCCREVHPPVASRSWRARCGCNSNCCTKPNCWRFLPSCATRCKRWSRSAPAPSNALQPATPFAAATSPS
jgi:hypothetical protein